MFRKKRSEIPHDPESDVADLISSIMASEGAEKFWERLYRTKADSLSMVSDLRRNEITDRLSALWFARTFDIPDVADLVDIDLAMRVSLKRKGRTEAVQAMTGSAEREARRLLMMRKSG